MQVVSVAPLKRGTPIDELSYFTKDPVTPGALVTVPLRGRMTPAIVIRSVPVEEAKAEIKQADFALKKLEHVEAQAFFPPAFVTAAKATGAYFLASTGAAVQSLFPNTLLTPEHHKPTRVTTPAAIDKHARRFILQAEETERFATYKSHIREVFARGSSCFFVLPSVQEIEHAYATLEKGIQTYTFVLHSGLSKKELAKRWAAIGDTDHPILIIGTPLFLTAPRDDIGSIILDQESSGAYKQQARPFIDMRFYVERFADALGADLILGDLFLRVETLARMESGDVEPLLRPKSRITSDAVPTIVDMRKSGEQPAAGKIAIASRELVDLITETRKNGTQCFILGVRKGFAPMTVCGDCGTVVSCHACAAPLVLHKKSVLTKHKDSDGGAGAGDTFPMIFLCHRCGAEETSDTTCTHCGGWRLIPLGIGLEQAEETLANRFPDATIFRIDRDTVKRHGEAKKLADEFFRTPGAILLGTEMAIPYLTEPVATVAVLSVNSLLTIPDFRMGERVFRLLLRLREKARAHFLIQTRETDVPIFELAAQGNISEFLESELAVRKQLSYPPYSTILKFTFEGLRSEGEALMQEVERIFGAYHPVSFPGFIAKVKGKHVFHAIIKVPAGAWPNQEIFGLIRTLPPEITVRVNPDSVI